MRGHLGLGSNLGDRRAALQDAVDLLAARGVRATASSSVYATPPWGAVADQPDFLNACIAIETDLVPGAVLTACKAVERALGRPRPHEPGYVHHGPRPVDVDVLLLGDVELRSRRLTVPHPAITRRRFVLVPLLELDLALALPDGTALADALARLPLEEDVRRAGPPLRVR